MTATIHRLTAAPIGGISDGSAERLLDAAHALSRMPRSMATSIEVIEVDGPAPLIAIAADRAAASLDLVATVKTEPSLAVRFTRR